MHVTAVRQSQLSTPARRSRAVRRSHIRLRRTLAGSAVIASLLAVCPGAWANPIGYVYAGNGSGAQALEVAAGGQLAPVGGNAGSGGAIAMATVHAANGVNVYELAPQAGHPYGPFAITHFTIEPATGGLVQDGLPFGSFNSYSFPSAMYGFDGYSSGAQSMLYVVECAAIPCKGGRLDEVAVNPTDGSLSSKGAITTQNEGEAYEGVSGSGDQVVLLSVTQVIDYQERTVPQNYIYDGLINHQTGEVGFGPGYGMTQTGINPIEPCCGTPMGMAMSPTMLALNGNEGGAIVQGEPSRVFGVGIFSVGNGSVGGGDVAPINPITGTIGAPITIAGGRVLSAVEDPSEYPIGGALLVIAPGTPVQVGELSVDPSAGVIESLLTLGNTVYAGVQGEGIAQIGVASEGNFAALSPATAGPSGVTAMTGYLVAGPGEGGGPGPGGGGGSPPAGSGAGPGIGASQLGNPAHRHKKHHKKHKKHHHHHHG